MMNFTLRFFLCVALSFIPLTTFSTAVDPSAQFKLSDEDIKALGLPEGEAAELKQFFDALNNLSPAQKKELEDLGRQTEEKMRQKGLDPTNMDDLMKFMESEGAAAGPQKPTRRTPEAKPAFIEPTVEKPKIVPVASPASTLTMLHDIAKHLASLRQKAITRPAMSQRLASIQGELSELTYYIPLLTAPDLIALLSSKEFMSLHDNFEALHKALATYEPSIIARKPQLFENDPYEVLGVPYDAKKEQITERFNAAKAENSPATIEAHLKKEKVPAKNIKHQVKRARVAFGFVERAYKTLSSPKERAAADKHLQKKIAKEKSNEASSMHAFNEIYASLAGRVKSQLLPNIKQLLERYKPQELARAREQMDLERKAYERSKQIVKIPIATAQQPYMGGGPYEEFYRKMAQESYMKPQYPQQRFNGQSAGQQNGKGPEKAGEGAAGGGAAGKGGKKEGGKDGKGGEKDKSGKDGAKDGKDGKGPGGEAPKAEEKLDFSKIKVLDRLADLLGEADALKDTLTVAGPTRSGTTEGEEGEAEEPEELEGPTHVLKLDQILNSLKAELGGTRGGEVKPIDGSARHLDLFFQKRNLSEINNAMSNVMKTFAPKPGKKPSEAFKTAWKEHVWNPYGALINNWYHSAYPVLGGGVPVHPALAEMHGLKKPLADINKPASKKPKADQPASGPGAVDLSITRDNVSLLFQYFNKINQSLGLGAPPVVPVKPKKKLGE